MFMENMVYSLYFLLCIILSAQGLAFNEQFQASGTCSLRGNESYFKFSQLEGNSRSALQVCMEALGSGADKESRAYL